MQSGTMCHVIKAKLNYMYEYFYLAQNYIFFGTEIKC